MSTVWNKISQCLKPATALWN